MSGPLVVPWWTDVIRVIIALSSTAAFVLTLYARRHWSHRYVDTVLTVAAATFGVIATIRWGIVLVDVGGTSTLARVLRRGDITNVLRTMTDVVWCTALWLGGRRFHRDMVVRRTRRVTALLDNTEEVRFDDS